MGFRRCPKCDLNYIREDEKLCKVCSRSVKAAVEDEGIDAVMCIECGERPHIPGGELCKECLAEKKRLLARNDIGDTIHSIDAIDIDVEGDLDELEIEVTVMHPKTDKEGAAYEGEPEDEDDEMDSEDE